VNSLTHFPIAVKFPSRGYIWGRLQRVTGSFYASRKPADLDASFPKLVGLESWVVQFQHLDERLHYSPVCVGLLERLCYQLVVLSGHHYRTPLTAFSASTTDHKKLAHLSGVHPLPISSTVLTSRQMLLLDAIACMLGDGEVVG